MKCPKCGAKMDESMPFCPSCGSTWIRADVLNSQEKNSSVRKTLGPEAPKAKPVPKPEPVQEFEQPSHKKCGCLILVIIAILIAVWLGHSSDKPSTEPAQDTSMVSQTATVQQEQEPVQEENNEAEAEQSVEDSSDYTMQINFAPLAHQYSYAQTHNIALHNFSTKLNSVINWYNTNSAAMQDTDNMYHLNIDQKLLSSELCYKITSENTNYVYVGALKDNRPDGIGYIAKIDSDDLTLYVSNVYLGYFKDGYYDGYGLLFNDPDESDIADYQYYRDYPDKETFYTGEYLTCLNCVSYEGMFSKGEESGKGNEFVIDPVTQYQAYYYTHDSAPEGMLDFAIFETAGEYADGRQNGSVTIYGVNGCIAYKGLVKNGLKNGKGVEYYDNSNQVRYEGEYKNDNYNGQGTFYDEDGNVTYSGEWKDGDYA